MSLGIATFVRTVVQRSVLVLLNRYAVGNFVRFNDGTWGEIVPWPQPLKVGMRTLPTTYVRVMIVRPGQSSDHTPEYQNWPKRAIQVMRTPKEWSADPFMHHAKSAIDDLTKGVAKIISPAP